MQKRRRLMVTLPSDDFRRLERLAERDERATDQQASFLLRRVLASATDAQEVAGVGAASGVSRARLPPVVGSWRTASWSVSTATCAGAASGARTRPALGCSRSFRVGHRGTDRPSWWPENAGGRGRVRGAPGLGKEKT